MKALITAMALVTTLAGCVGVPDSSASPAATVGFATPPGAGAAATPTPTAGPDGNGTPRPSMAVEEVTHPESAALERIGELSRDTGLCIAHRQPEVSLEALELQARTLLASSDGPGLLDDPAFYRGPTRLDAAIAFGASELFASQSDEHAGWIIRRAAGERMIAVRDGLPIAYRLFHVSVDGQDVFMIRGAAIWPSECHGDGT